MPSVSPSRILLCAESPAAVADVRPHLEQAGYRVGWLAFDAPEPEDVLAYDLVVLESGPRDREAVQVCRRLRSRLADAFVPLLFLTASREPGARLSGLESGADTYLLRPFSPSELFAQVGALLRLKGLHDRLTEKTAEFHRVNKRLQLAYQQIDQELQLARRIQHSLLPQTLPNMAPGHFAVHYRPCGRVGGDFYDVFRLDENHAGFYVADVMGHGVPAALVTIFLKKAFCPKEIFEHHYRLLPPDEVLHRLNREMLEQALAENPFITMVYGLFDRRDGTLSFSRAGHPHPLYVPAAGKPELWQVHGSLLGVFETQFTVQTRRLQPGDKLLLYTDGMDLDSDESQPGGIDRLLDCAEKNRKLPLAEFIAQVAHDMVGPVAQLDDLTLLGLALEEKPGIR